MSNARPFVTSANNAWFHLKTKNLRLVPHQPKDLLALLKGSAEYEKSSGIGVADGVREFLLAASPDFLAELERATGPDLWRFGFAVVHKIDNIVIGICGFAGPPTEPDGTIEIAYSIAPAYQGKGYATEGAMALVEFALGSGRVATVCAHTLPDLSASTRVLEKCGFKKIGTLTDSENNLVWRWERSASASSNRER